MSSATLARTAALVSNRQLLITPGYVRFMALNPNPTYPLRVVTRISRLLLAKPRIRAGTFSASSSGTCLRAQELGYLGMPATAQYLPTPEQAAIFNDGHWRHRRWQANLLTGRQLIQVERATRWPARRAYGTLDGLGVAPQDHPLYGGLEFGFELKGVNPFDYPRWVAAPRPQYHHLLQIHRYMLMMGLELFVVIYESKATNEWHEWVIRPSVQLLEESNDELERLNGAIDAGQLTPMLGMCKARKGPAWEGCPFAGPGGTCERAGLWPKKK